MVRSSMRCRDKPHQKAGTVLGTKKSAEVVRGISTHASKTKEITCRALLGGRNQTERPPKRL
jgi:hypothetical protein